MTVLVILLLIGGVGVGWLAWCWMGGVVHRRRLRQLGLEAVVAQLDGLRTALQVELAGQVAQQRLMDEMRCAEAVRMPPGGLRWAPAGSLRSRTRPE